MSVIELHNATTGARATLAPQRGMNCFDLRLPHPDTGELFPVLWSADNFPAPESAPSHSGIPLLFPYPNRIAGGRYSWAGKDYHLPPSVVSYEGNGNAIHGFCLDRPWRVTSQTADSVDAEFRFSVDCPDRAELWPADAEIRIRYQLNNAGLLMNVTVHNPDTKPLPWGFGTHAYFRLPGSPDATTIHAPAHQLRELKDCLPTGATLAVTPQKDLTSSPVFSSLKLDDAYTDLRPNGQSVQCRMTNPESGLTVEQSFPTDFPELVAFTPPWAPAVCLEPYTCCTNAINLAQRGVKCGLNVLPPGDSWSSEIMIRLIDTTPA